MKNFLSTYSSWFNWGWIVIFFVHIHINYLIYLKINKEEFKDVLSTPGRSILPLLLSIFTVKWSKNYQLDESVSTQKLMRIGNIINMIFLVYTILISCMWIYTYGK